MNTVLDLLLIAVIVCYIIDLSGVIQSMEEGLSRLLKYRVSIPRPFSCSLCSVWWTGLIYLIVVHKFCLWYIALVALISFFSNTISGLIRWVNEFVIWIIGWLYKIIR